MTLRVQRAMGRRARGILAKLFLLVLSNSSSVTHKIGGLALAEQILGFRLASRQNQTRLIPGLLQPVKPFVKTATGKIQAAINIETDGHRKRADPNVRHEMVCTAAQTAGRD